MIKINLLKEVTLAIKKRGASFCTVDKIKQLVHDAHCITEGNQKWYGGIPSLIKRAIIKIVVNNLEGIFIEKGIIRNKTRRDVIA